MRSVNTSLVVLLPILSLLLFGGDTLKDFAFAMFIGVAIGAYSSIFIAAPVLAILKEREQRFQPTRATARRRGHGRAAPRPAPRRPRRRGAGGGRGRTPRRGRDREAGTGVRAGRDRSRSGGPRPSASGGKPWRSSRSRP